MEVAGVVLGAVALVGPVHDLYDKCTTIFANIHNYTSDLRQCEEKLTVQKLMFLQSLQLLLRNLVQDDLAESMAKDKTHQKWKDLKFKADWGKVMGKCFDDLLGGIHETLREIEGKLSRLHVTGGGIQNSTSVSPSSNIVSRKGLATWALRAGWAVSGRREVEILINTLRVQNQDLGRLQRQQNSLRKKVGVSPRPQAFRSKLLDSKAILAQLLAISEVAKRVYDGLAVTARCSCHCVNFQLRGQPEGPDISTRNTSLDLTYNASNLAGSASAVNFYLILTKEIGNQNINLNSDGRCECTCITISSDVWQFPPGNSTQQSHRVPDPKRIIKFGDIETSSARAIITVTDDNQPSKKRAMSIDLGTGKKRLKLEFAETNHQSHPATICSATVDIQTNNITRNIDENSTTLSVTPRDNIEIDSLCLRLAKLRPDVRGRELLGKIPLNERDNLTHHSCLMYREPVSGFISRTSLEEILTRPDKECLLPPMERLRIAHRLSLSLLYFGPSSPSWFQERWRSRDIFFFLKLQLPDSGYALDPYIVPCFSAIVKPPSINTKTLAISLKGIAPNEQLFSLAIVLIEIAFGEKLLNIYEPKEIPKKDGDDFTEILKARSILSSNTLLKKMGPKYSNVAKRCLDCRFDGTLECDLSNTEFQGIYYEQVVRELEFCLKAVQKMHGT